MVELTSGGVSTLVSMLLIFSFYDGDRTLCEDSVMCFLVPDRGSVW